MACPLCDIERRTKWHYHDAICVVCDCESCTEKHGHSVPMLVFRKHGRASMAEKAHAQKVVDRLKMKITRTQPRKIPAHDHYHLEAT